jgi:hypothetical protein
MKFHGPAAPKKALECHPPQGPFVLEPGAVFIETQGFGGASVPDQRGRVSGRAFFSARRGDDSGGNGGTTDDRRTAPPASESKSQTGPA